MEGVMKKQWKEEEEEAEVEEVGLRRRQAHQQVSTITCFSDIHMQGQEISETKNDSSGIEIEKNNIPLLSSVIYRDYSTPPKNVTFESVNFEKSGVCYRQISNGQEITETKNGTFESERVGLITEDMRLVKELYLESLYQKASTQGFYCPNCRTCVQKVLILDAAAQPLQPVERFRCSTCFSFLIPIGSWVFPWLKPDNEERAEDEPKRKVPARDQGKPQPDPTITEDAQKTPPHQVIDISKGEQGQDDISKFPEQQNPVEDVEHGGASKEPQGGTRTSDSNKTRKNEAEEEGSSKAWDIVKSFVYGGLIEHIASLGIVASSASADATTLSIVALSLANLIGGLFVLVHDVWDLKSEQQSRNEVVDRYYVSLGKRENFYLHLCVAILSFIIFGLVPPLVYGFTFYKTNNKDLTLVALAGASVICISLLAIAKAYIQRPDAYLMYLKTVFYYLNVGALSSVIAYLAGVLIRKLLEKLGIGSESSLDYYYNMMMLAEMSITEKPRFGSYL